MHLGRAQKLEVLLDGILLFHHSAQTIIYTGAVIWVETLKKLHPLIDYIRTDNSESCQNACILSKWTNVHLTAFWASEEIGNDY